MTDSKPMRAELVDDYRIKCALLLEEVIDAEEAAKLAAAEIAELRAERDRLKADVDAAVVEAVKFIYKNTGLKLQRDRLKVEHDRHLADAIEAQADVKRITAERDRLKAALEEIGRQKTSEEMEGYEAFDADFEGGWDTVVTNARKALGDAS